MAKLYAAIEKVSDGRMIVDSSKIPTYSMVLRLAGVQQSVVHLVRDSRGVVHSWRKEIQRTDATVDPDVMHRYGAVPASLRYLFYNGATHLLRRAGQPYLRVRYEDLVAEPAVTLKAVVAFAGLELSPAVSADLARRTVTLRRSHTVDGNPMRMRVGTTDIVVDDAWRERLPAVVRRTVGVLTWPLLRRYGYLGRDAAARDRVAVR